jgi:hypothetical protein
MQRRAGHAHRTLWISRAVRGLLNIHHQRALPVMTAPPGMAMDTVWPTTTARPSHFTCIRAAASANSGTANSRANNLARFIVPITFPHYRTAQKMGTDAFSAAENASVPFFSSNCDNL